MRIGTFSKNIHLIQHINQFLNAEEVTLFPSPTSCKTLDLIVGWGRELNASNAKETADFHDINFTTVEDGFIGCGLNGIPRTSLVLDSVGIHYDSSQPSELENIIEKKKLSKKLLADAEKAIQIIKKNKLSKFSGNDPIPSDYFSTSKQKVLVVDQLIKDPSISFGESINTDEMISSALYENPEAKIYLKLLPESYTGNRKSILYKYHNHPQIEVIRDNFNPFSLLENMDKVYVSSSHLGFEALLQGKDVVCFGLPFYAGWGLTDDRVQCARRNQKRSITELFAAAYIKYSRYVHPVSGRSTDILEALNYLREQREIEFLNSADIYCFGVRHWTRSNIKPFLRSSKNKILFVKSVSTAKQAGIKKGDRVAIWGNRRPDRLEELLTITGTGLISLEKDLLSNFGLDSNSVRPSSLIVDNEGIYYDSTRASHLESLLQDSHFTTNQLKRSSSIQKKLNTFRKTKLVLKTDVKSGQKIILIPGETKNHYPDNSSEDEINSNLSLIQNVRIQNPDAYIIYKPHPEVVNGNKDGKLSGDTVLKYCDQYVEITDIYTCMDTADEVHTFSSFVGFEALLKKIPTTTYGKPFYAGWGLTKDNKVLERRKRKLTLNELVAGTLLLYPRYYDWDSGSFTDCESIIDKHINKNQIKSNGSKVKSIYTDKHVEKLKILIEGLVS